MTGAELSFRRDEPLRHRPDDSRASPVLVAAESLTMVRMQVPARLSVIKAATSIAYSAEDGDLLPCPVVERTLDGLADSVQKKGPNLTAIFDRLNQVVFYSSLCITSLCISFLGQIFQSPNDKLDRQRDIENAAIFGGEVGIVASFAQKLFQRMRRGFEVLLCLHTESVFLCRM
ncbi:hypothetical protein KC345_g65 [Hortaea werneckii]|nr:hypothetical protein KC345_g65 [Hortaea werneckii]